MTERQVELMQTLFRIHEDVACNEEPAKFHQMIGCTEREYDELHALFF